jgi:dolichol kinase
VAAPFVLVTFLVSPYSPFPNIGRKLTGLAGITEEGHRLGLLFYSLSYTVLALIFAARPYVIAAGILPMAYGDAAASIVGERYGRRGFRVFARKSLEGSAAMFLASFLSLLIGLAFFSGFYSFSIYAETFAVFAVAAMATLVECISPMGLDNLFVPVLSALTFLTLSGGI